MRRQFALVFEKYFKEEETKQLLKELSISIGSGEYFFMDKFPFMFQQAYPPDQRTDQIRHWESKINDVMQQS